MKIVSYNVNGIRSALRKGFASWLKFENPDIVCLQEIKALESQIDLKAFSSIGFKYNYFFSAKKKGYSGVAVLSKFKPLHVEYGIGISDIDDEGRNLRLDFKNFSVMSLYLPSGTNIKRLEFKLNYMSKFLNYIKILNKHFKNLIIAGDFNICHKHIDIHDPVRNKNISGFLPIEREWLQKFIELGFIDSFREFNSDPFHYSWWTYRANARSNNKGWRIDYIMISLSLSKKLKSASILNNIVHSDHCPISVDL
tara:strand:- start:10714 stop:11472 length:759 start_codon:yes stop_codon:yes gene_type:complete